MREISYRLWDTKQKKFWHDFRIHPSGTFHPATGSKIVKGVDYWVYDYKYNQKYLMPCEFTGLKDKNGAKIYEGDIVKISVNPYHGVFEVKFGKYKLVEQHKHQIERPAIGWYLQRKLDILSLMYAVEQDKGWFASKHIVEVIGNIYENKELLDA